jgi:signal transduction histidine kinase/CheY-like chemotaxis protein
MNSHEAETERYVRQLLEEAHTVRVKELDKSLQLAKTALAVSREKSLPSLEALSCSRIAFYKMIKGSYDQALNLAENAAVIFETLHDEMGLADARFTIASVHYKTDNLHLGLKYMLECLAIYQKYQDYQSQAKVLKTLGTIYEFFNDIPRAVQAYEETVTAARMAGDMNMVSNAYNPLSGLYLNNNDIKKATEIIEASIALKKETGDTRGLGFAYYGRGKIYTKTGAYDKAKADFEASLHIHEEAGEKLGWCMTAQKMGVLFMVSGEPLRAVEYLTRALEMGEKNKMRIAKNGSSHLLYQLYKQLGQADKALYYLEKNVAFREEGERNQTSQIVSSYERIMKMEAQQMQDKLEEERQEIEEKKNQAEYAARARQDFLSNMSHEIRTPLNAVITITNLLKDRSDEEDQKLIESLKFASHNLLLLINDILDFTKIETGKVQLEPRPASIRGLMTNIINTYDGLAREKGLDLQFSVGKDIDSVYEIDETKLSQILGNLLSNAIKFTDRGTVHLDLTKTGASGDSHALYFKVTDTGAGIPDDFMGEIFDAFTQPRSVTTKKQGGSGLGLAIVKKLVELHHSDIHIETQLGKGTSFSFTLLLKPAAAPVIKAPQQNFSLQGCHVLLAEDNTINMMVANKLLSRWGVTTDGARNGIEAVDLASKRKYNVILMDIHMPEMNGYDATLKIRSSENPNNQTPIYALTADITATDHPADVHFSGFLRKPIEVDQLYQALSGHVH